MFLTGTNVYYWKGREYEYFNENCQRKSTTTWFTLSGAAGEVREVCLSSRLMVFNNDNVIMNNSGG